MVKNKFTISAFFIIYMFFISLYAFGIVVGRKSMKSHGKDLDVACETMLRELINDTLECESKIPVCEDIYKQCIPYLEKGE